MCLEIILISPPAPKRSSTTRRNSVEISTRVEIRNLANGVFG